MTIRKYDRIYEVIRQISPGKVATYGQIAKIVGECTPRMVGYALAALKPGSDVPWQRVINSQGKISLRNDGCESIEQRLLLEGEGVHFNQKGIVDLEKFGWHN
jgi:methylated-DNA-protein-cysteine methyltransferase-like protein